MIAAAAAVAAAVQQRTCAPLAYSSGIPASAEQPNQKSK
jgi:hypothetical protein